MERVLNSQTISAARLLVRYHAVLFRLSFVIAKIYNFLQLFVTPSHLF
jgi:hypothetical protein